MDLRGNEEAQGMIQHPMATPTLPRLELDVIDPRITLEYQNPEIYEQNGESSTFKSCHSLCGTIPATVCVCCAPCGLGPLKKIYQGNVGLRIRHGKVVEKLPPGLHTVNKCSDTIVGVDLRQKTMTVRHSYITKDNLTIHVKAFGIWRVTHPEMYAFRVANYGLLVGSALRGVICSLSTGHRLEEIMSQRKHLEAKCLNLINSKAVDLGIIFSSIELNEISLGADIQNAVSALALAKSQSKAKLIVAKGEIDSALMYKQSADQISGNPISLQLQYLEVMKEIAKETPSTLILPDTCIGNWNNLNTSAKYNAEERAEGVKNGWSDEVYDTRDQAKMDSIPSNSGGNGTRNENSSKGTFDRSRYDVDLGQRKSAVEDKGLDGIAMLNNL